MLFGTRNAWVSPAKLRMPAECVSSFIQCRAALVGEFVGQLLPTPPPGADGLNQQYGYVLTVLGIEFCGHVKRSSHFC
ncbi:hypothetical protein DIPPA_05194 [Diplonema papillatum]|nr:hypothetical protein DIPPA_05194 [Diplonema papillatum]